MNNSADQNSSDVNAAVESDREGNHWLLCVILMLLGLFLLGRSLQNARKSTQAATWPTVPATITHLELMEISDIDGTSYHVDVEYNYRINRFPHEGSRIAFGYSGTFVRHVHDEIYRKLKEAQVVFVRYDPSDPSMSCLSFGVNRGIQLTLWWGVFLLSLISFSGFRRFVSKDRGGYTFLVALVVEVILFVWLFFTSDTVLLDNLSVQ